MKTSTPNPAAVAELMTHLERLDAIAAGEKDLRSDTRERVLDAALEQLATEGFAATSVRKLGAAVGISAAAIYSHFASKEALLSAGLARTYAAFLRFVFDVDEDSADMDETLPQIARRHMRFQIEQRVHAESSDRLLTTDVLDRHLDPDTVAVFRGAQRFYLARVRAAVARYRGRSSLDASLEAEAILTLCDSVKGGPRVRPTHSTDELIDYYLVVIDRILRVDDHP